MRSHHLRLSIRPVLDGHEYLGETHVDLELPPMEPDRQLAQENTTLRADICQLRATNAQLATDFALLRRRHRPWWAKVIGK